MEPLFITFVFKGNSLKQQRAWWEYSDIAFLQKEKTAFNQGSWNDDSGFNNVLIDNGDVSKSTHSLPF